MNFLKGISTVIAGLLFLSFFSSCDSQQTISDVCQCADDKRQFTQYYDEFALTEINNFYTQKESKYLVYMYSVTCPSCESIRGCIFDYLDSDYTKMYLCDVLKMFKTTNPFITINVSEFDENKHLHVQNVHETVYVGTPSLYEIENNELIKLYIGRTKVLEFLEKMLC